MIVVTPNTFKNSFKGNCLRSANNLAACNLEVVTTRPIVSWFLSSFLLIKLKYHGNR
jgi:hypothetical protein